VVSVAAATVGAMVATCTKKSTLPVIAFPTVTMTRPTKEGGSDFRSGIRC